MKFIGKYEIVGRGLYLYMETEKSDGIIRIGDCIPYDGKLYEIRGIDMSYKLVSPPILSNKVGYIVRAVGYA